MIQPHSAPLSHHSLSRGDKGRKNSAPNNHNNFFRVDLSEEGIYIGGAPKAGGSHSPHYIVRCNLHKSNISQVQYGDSLNNKAPFSWFSQPHGCCKRGSIICNTVSGQDFTSQIVKVNLD